MIHVFYNSASVLIYMKFGYDIFYSYKINSFVKKENLYRVLVLYHKLQLGIIPLLFTKYGIVPNIVSGN